MLVADGLGAYGYQSQPRKSLMSNTFSPDFTLKPSRGPIWQRTFIPIPMPQHPILQPVDRRMNQVYRRNAHAQMIPSSFFSSNTSPSLIYPRTILTAEEASLTILDICNSTKDGTAATISSGTGWPDSLVRLRNNVDGKPNRRPSA